jgi:hypothetical protein
MKKQAKRGLMLLLAALAVIVVALAAPAGAQAQIEPITYEVPAFVGVYFDEGQVAPGPDITPLFTLPEEEGGPGYARDPQVGDTMDFSYGWWTYNRGLTLTAPRYTVLKLWVDGPGDYDFVIGAKAAGEHWGKAYVLDAPEVPPFNPRIGSKAWVIDWDYALPLTVAGDYKVHFYQDFRHTTTDLTVMPNPDYDENDPDSSPWLDKFAGHAMLIPGDGLGHSYFYFTVM